MPQLRKLYLGANLLRSTAGLELCTNLEELHLNDQAVESALEITSDVIDAAAGSLTVLNVSGTRLAAAALEALAPLSRLRSLDLSNNAIGDASALERPLGNMPRLEKISVAGNPIAQKRIRDIIILAGDAVQVRRRCLRKLAGCRTVEVQITTVEHTRHQSCRVVSCRAGD